MIPDLPPDAERLLQKLAEREYRNSCDITEELLKELGFDSESALAAAVSCLAAHAHDHKDQWGNGPIIYIDEEERRLVPGPFMKVCWGRYQAERR